MSLCTQESPTQACLFASERDNLCSVRFKLFPEAPVKVRKFNLITE